MKNPHTKTLHTTCQADRHSNGLGWRFPTARFLLVVACVAMGLSACDRTTDTDNDVEVNIDLTKTATPTSSADNVAQKTASGEAASEEIASETASEAVTTGIEPLALLPDSSISFTAQQLGIDLDGRFKTFTADIQLDPANTNAEQLANASIQFSVDTHSITVGMLDTDKELTGEAWFGGASNKDAVFVSSLITQPAPNQFEITGMLTIKGKSLPVTTLATVTPAGDGQWQANGEFEIKRLAYAIGTNPWDDTSIVGDEVVVKYALLLQ